MNNDKNYKTLVLAALLHDIGKPLQFAKLNPKLAQTDKYRHPAYSIDIFKYFVFGQTVEWILDLDKTLTSLKLSSDLVDWQLLDELVSRHHLEGGNALELIIKAADGLASSERTTKENEDDPQNAIMESILSKLGPVSQSATGWYKPAKLLKDKFEEILFPSETDSTFTPEQRKNACKDMLSEFRVILESWDNSKKNVDVLISMLDVWLYKHYWMWPATRGRNDEKDISLYDHLKITTAITACLYQGTVNAKIEFYSKNDLASLKRENYFKIIQADFSGIQKYIFDITTSKAAKRLRARSFYVQALTENIAYNILKEYQLPLQCIISSAGGKFMLLIPAFTEVKFEELKSKIQTTIYRNYRGEITLNLCCSEPFGGEYFQGKRTAEEASKWKVNPDKYYASLVKNILKPQFEKEKKQSSKSFLQGEEKWKSQEFIHALSKNSKDCKGCGKPFPEEELAPTSDNKEETFCKLCFKDQEIGRELGKDHSILVYETDAIIPEIKLIDHLGKNKQTPKRLVLMNPLEEKSIKNFEIHLAPMSLKFMANYVPRKASGDAMEFSDIAQLAGSPMLAVLKMDVDNLGALFSSISEETFTITRIATLSRMLDLFFSGYLETLIRNEKEYKETYCVYAGGDDVLLIGPWTSMLKLAQRIREDFQRFTCNDSITLSAGLSFFKEKYPIYRAIQQAEEELKNAKNAKQEEKNAISLGGKRIPWSDYPNILEQANQLVKWMSSIADDNNWVGNSRDSSLPISTGFVRNLLEFARMQDLPKNNPNKYRWKPLLAYQMARNIKKIDIQGNETEIWKWLEPLISEQFEPVVNGRDHSLQVRRKYLEIIATIALYRVRGVDAGGKK